MTGAPARARVTYLQPDGSRRQVEVRAGTSVMEAALRAGIAGIEARCRGNCACVTCHVHVDPRWTAVLGPRSAMEESMLDFAEGADARSRLACQLRVDGRCDGLVVEVPAEQRVLGF
jgi:2Fe-2S ferredoxin